MIKYLLYLSIGLFVAFACKLRIEESSVKAQKKNEIESLTNSTRWATCLPLDFDNLGKRNVHHFIYSIYLVGNSPDLVDFNSENVVVVSDNMGIHIADVTPIKGDKGSDGWKIKYNGFLDDQIEMQFGPRVRHTLKRKSLSRFKYDGDASCRFMYGRGEATELSEKTAQE